MNRQIYANVLSYNAKLVVSI